jgi:uncharacterized membrane protein YfcA
MQELPALCLFVFVVAVLYASVGHGGASGYLASMALLGMAPAVMKPTALLLNVLVAGVGSARYIKSDCFNLRRFLQFAAGAVPFAFLGGSTSPPDRAYRIILGVALMIAAAGLLVSARREGARRDVHPILAVGIGAAIGYVSGLIGVGGGIFLSPILILTGWASTKETLGTSALFILVNSIAGLLGHVGGLLTLPSQTLWFAPCAFAGGLIGSTLGAKTVPPTWLRILLAAAVLIAAAKLLFT